jgi:arginase
VGRLTRHPPTARRRLDDLAGGTDQKDEEGRPTCCDLRADGVGADSKPPSADTLARNLARAGRAVRAGLLRNLAARDAGSVPVPPYRFERDPATGIHNRDGIAAQTRALAAAVGTSLDQGERVLINGGDCSVLIGAALALRRRGRHGLVFIDGHLDFRHLGNSNRLSAAAGEDLAIVTGRGLEDHANIDGLGPYFQDSDVVAVGEREADPRHDIEATQIIVFDLAHVRRAGAETVATLAQERLSAAEAGYWVHLDVDVLDSELLSAVDSPQPDGLQPHELVPLLRTLASTGACAAST